jgi:hypothetical protein
MTKNLSATSSRLSLIAWGGLAAACLPACGDPLVTAEDRGDALFGVHGQALLGSQAVAAADYAVAVVFLRVVTGHDPALTGKLETEVIPGKIVGEFPAKFSVELKQAPTAYPYNVNVIYGTIGGEQMDGVFAVSNAPDGVRIGHLAIGPAGELAGLPAKIDFSIARGDRTMGKALAPFLPTTTITSYQVIYAEGVGPGDVIYPKYKPTGVEGGKPITDGFTLVDARTYFEATKWQECANDVYGAAYETPEYDACTAANAGLIGCLAACMSQAPTSCNSKCYASFPGQLDNNGCLAQVTRATISATCGPQKVPNRDQLRILRPEDALSVTLGTDDVKAGMWVLHATGL